MTRIRHLAEYAALRIAFFLVDAFPASWTEGTFQRVADFCYLILRKRRRIARANVRRAGIAAEPAEIDRIVRASYRHLALALAETFELNQRNCEDVWEQQVELDASPEALEVLRDEKVGALIASGHLGNWEVGALVTSHLKPLFAIARPMNNPYTDRLVTARRPRQRVRFTPKHAPERRRFLDALKRGEGVVVMADQHGGRSGMPIGFFGVAASTHTSVAKLHLLTGAPIVFVCCLRTAPHRYRLRIRGPIVHEPTGDKRADVRAILQKVTAMLEEAIRAYPRQYLWAHRRWRAHEIAAHARAAGSDH